MIADAKPFAYRVNNVYHSHMSKSSKKKATIKHAKFQGLVISHFGTQVEVRDSSGKHFRCLTRKSLKGKKGVVAGDFVEFSPPSEISDGIIHKRLKRKNVLERPDNFGNIKAVAANIDQAVILFAPFPTPSSTLIDSYLIAASQANITPVLAINKTDLAVDDELQSLLNVYRDIGYDVLEMSVVDDKVDALITIMKEKKTVLVGQSGVGKSSLINHILPEAEQAVNIISGNSKLGQHTTTTARLFMLNEQTNSFLMDSPGIREFQLWHIEPEAIQNHYTEFEPFLGYCKFRNCHHKSEPECAIKDAVTENKIHPLRWQNFNKIRSTIEDTQAEKNYNFE